MAKRLTLEEKQRRQDLKESSRKAKQLIRETKKKIVLRFLKPTAKIDWVVEIGVLNKLLVKYNFFEFWLNYDIINFKLNSLRFFLTENGGIALEEAFLEWKKRSSLDNIMITPTVNIDIADKKFGEDFVSTKKNILDFIN